MYLIINKHQAGQRAKGLKISAILRLTNRKSVLDQLGLSPRSSDGELLISAYKKWGDDCPTHFEGDFTFAIFDPESGNFFGARDKVGMLPFYYRVGQEKAIFSSRQDKIIESSTEALSIDFEFASYVLWMEWIPPDRTFFKQILRLPPAHRISLKANRLKIDRYWEFELPPVNVSKSEKDWVEELDDILSHAVSDRISNHDKIGVFQSGGMDSSLVIKLCEKSLGNEANDRLWGLTRYGETQSCDERERVAKVNAEGSWKSLLVSLNPNQSAYDLRSLERFKTLFYTPILFSDIPLLDAARNRGVSLVMGGIGGDDIFSPDYYAADFLRERKIMKFREALQYSLPDYTNYWQCLWQEGLRPQLVQLRNNYIPQLIRRKPCYELHPENPWRPALLEQVEQNYRASHRKLSCAHHNLYRRLIVKNSYAWGLDQQIGLALKHGIQLVHPLFDRRVIEFAFSMPTQLFFGENRSKYLLRRVAERYLPASICWDEPFTDYSPVEAKVWECQWPELVGRLRNFRRRMPSIIRDEVLDSLQDHSEVKARRLPLLLALNLENSYQLTQNRRGRRERKKFKESLPTTKTY